MSNLTAEQKTGIREMVQLLEGYIAMGIPKERSLKLTRKRYGPPKYKDEVSHLTQLADWLTKRYAKELL